MTYTIAGAVSSIFGDEALSDIHLQGVDSGSNIPAVRAILAARSPVFRCMLYGEFLEASSSLIRFAQWENYILRAVVEFCYTDDLEMMQEDISEDHARKMVHIIAAAEFFEIPALEHSIFEWMSDNLSRYPSLACIVLDEMAKSGLSEHYLMKCVTSIIRMKPKASLFPDENIVGNGILSLDKCSLESILLPTEEITSQISFFQALKMWKEFIKKKNVSFFLESKMDAERITGSEVSCDMAEKFIKLSKIWPLDTDYLVEESRIFASDSNLVSPKEIKGDFHDNQRQDIFSVSSVDVRGSGIPVVNGTYIVCGEQNGAPLYIKKGAWNEQVETFELYFKQILRANKKAGNRWSGWRIRRRSTSQLLYNSKLFDADKCEIPKGKWQVARGNKIGPAPTLSYSY